MAVTALDEVAVQRTISPQDSYSVGVDPNACEVCRIRPYDGKPTTQRVLFSQKWKNKSGSGLPPTMCLAGEEGKPNRGGIDWM